MEKFKGRRKEFQVGCDGVRWGGLLQGFHYEIDERHGPHGEAE